MSRHLAQFFIFLIGLAFCFNAEPGKDGKYRPSKTKYSDGIYITRNEAPKAIRSIDSNFNRNKGFQEYSNFQKADTSSGKYVHKVLPYVHVHDNRELGRYVHIHIPYNGGYGPYSGDEDKYRYLFDNKGDYSLYTVSKNNKDPFNAQFYDIPKPEVYLEYGFPDHSPKIEKRSISSLPPLLSSHANKNTLHHYFLTKILAPIDFYSYFMNSNDGGILQQHQNENVLDSQTTTTTTQRPRTRYDDEGKWRILRQEEEKNQKKYDYLYLTENGIYAEEQASLINQNMKADGTNAQGYYQYTGDDGKLYKVVYTVGEQGFVPMGDHIPPVPIAIQKALEYVAAKKKKESETNSSTDKKFSFRSLMQPTSLPSSVSSASPLLSSSSTLSSSSNTLSLLK